MTQADATRPDGSELSAELGNEFAWLTARIDAEMAEYWDGAYADSGCAKDQLERFAAEVMAPLHARIRELTLYAAQVEAERDAARAEAATAYDVFGPMIGKCQACGHEHELPNF